MFAWVLVAAAAVAAAAPAPDAAAAAGGGGGAGFQDNTVREGEVAPDHDFKVRWPKGAPKGVIVFLHGVSIDPFLVEEEGTGIEALANLANRRGYVAVIPIGRKVCDWDRPKVYQYCWLLDQVDDEVADVRRIIRRLESKAGVHFQKRQIVGFSNGGFLVAGALQRGLLADFNRVGILSAGPVGDDEPPPAVPLPHIFIEVGKDDRFQKGSTRELMDLLAASVPPGTRIHYREVDGGHQFDKERAAQFLAWFWGDAS